MSNSLIGNIIDNIIVLRSVYGKVGQKYYIQPCKDPKTGRFPDCVKPVNSSNDIILSDAERNSGEYFIKESETFIIEDGTTFDLNDEIQSKIWQAIKNCNLIASERFAKDADGNYLIDGTADKKARRQRYGIAELYVEHPGLESTLKVNRKRKVHNACTFILDDERGVEGRLLKARLLGKNMKNMPDSDVEAFLLDLAERDPDKIISLYTDNDLNLRYLLMEAKDKKVIVVKNGVYVYGDTDVILGASDDAALAWMKTAKNKKALELIRKDTTLDIIND